MSIKRTYVCDLCDAGQETDNQFWRLSVSLDRHPSVVALYTGDHIDLCRPCVDRLSLIPLTSRKSPSEPAPPTLAVKLEAVIREMVEVAVDWRRND